MRARLVRTRTIAKSWLCVTGGLIVLSNRVGAGVSQILFEHEFLTTAATQRKLAVACRLCRTNNLDLNLADRLGTNPDLPFFEVHVFLPEVTCRLPHRETARALPRQSWHDNQAFGPVRNGRREGPAISFFLRSQSLAMQ